MSTGLAVLWLWLTRAEPAAPPRTTSGRCGCRSAGSLAWRLVAAFFFMSSVFYGLNAWLPDVYVERGWSEASAGALLAVLNTVTIPCGFAVAWAADHCGSRRALARRRRLAANWSRCSESSCWPAGGWVWAVLLGLASVRSSR